MRQITTHHTNECNKAITLTADDRDQSNGNASHRYTMEYRDCTADGSTGFGAEQEVSFQHGPIAEVGVNGITNEVLLAIVIDRLEGFQTSKYANVYNARALDRCRDALETLELRTREREARGVEGTHEV